MGRGQSFKLDNTVREQAQSDRACNSFNFAVSEILEGFLFSTFHAFVNFALCLLFYLSSWAEIVTYFNRLTIIMVNDQKSIMTNAMKNKNITLNIKRLPQFCFRYFPDEEVFCVTEIYFDHLSAKWFLLSKCLI
jgi:hypothetical protein